MLFHSFEFLFLFLPVTFGGWLAVGRFVGWRASLWWLLLCSFFFYSWWEPRSLPLFLTSIVVNFAIGRYLAEPRRPGRRGVFLAGLLLNLGALGYFKYADFVVRTGNQLFGTAFDARHPVLPLAISFFTFQQLAYLIETYRGRSAGETFLEYALFVAFFPHLIAGPITHHLEMVPQFRGPVRRRLDSDVAVGLTLLIVGLFKKLVLADSFGGYVPPAFNATEHGDPLSVAEAWIAAFAFLLQIYFDFSGYTDMALGLSRLFGIALPLNFESPLKAASITDFWRRWHITLSRFLREYCYVPLRGEQHGLRRRCWALLVTMTLCGLWHGAGWNFVTFGLIQGLLLAAELCWRKVLGDWPEKISPVLRAARCVLTVTLFATTLVVFRSETLDGAARYFATLAGVGGAELRGSACFKTVGLRSAPGAMLVIAGLAITWALPNTQQMMGRFRPAIGYRFRFAGQGVLGKAMARLQWRPRWIDALTYALVLAFSLCSISKAQEFFYFQF